MSEPEEQLIILEREAVSLLAQRDFSQALRCLDTITQMEKDHDTRADAARPGYAHYLRALCHLGMGDYLAADRDMGRALSLEPHNLDYYLAVAEIRRRLRS